MKKLMMIVIVVCLLAMPAGAEEPLDTTENDIKAVVLDYIESFYEGDAARMENALYPSLAKRTLRYDPLTGKPGLDELSAERLVEGVAAGWGTETASSDRLADVEILDIRGDMASAKLKAAKFHDYLHLQRFGDQWKIVNVLWARNPPDIAPEITAAVKHPDRPRKERLDDDLRKPEEILAFAGIKEDMIVADLMAGTGWYTEIIARAVGPYGLVYMQNNETVIEKFADSGVEKRLANARLPNVARWDRELTDLGFKPSSLDVAVMILFYHDTFWMGVDRASMNREIFEAIKAGGTFLVVDHFAETGSGARDVESLHRGDADLIRDEILKAGFVFDGSSPVLRHPEDKRTLSVFDDRIRRKTDRFVYRFKKPR